MNKKNKKAISIIVIIALISFCAWKYFFSSVVSVENIIEDAGPLRDAVILLQDTSSGYGREKAYTVTTQNVREADFEMASLGIVPKNAARQIKKLGGEDIAGTQLVYSNKNEGGEIYVYSADTQWIVLIAQNTDVWQISVQKDSANESFLAVQHAKDKVYLHRRTESGQRIITEIDPQKLVTAEIIRFMEQDDFGSAQKFDTMRGETIILSDNRKIISVLNQDAESTKRAELEREATDVFAKDGGYIAVENNSMNAVVLHYFDENMNKIDEKTIEIPAIASEQPSAAKGAAFVALDGEILYSIAAEGERAAICAIDLTNQELLQISSIKVQGSYKIQACKFLNVAGEALAQ